MQRFILTIFALFSPVALSCPVCHTSNGQIVRAEIFNSSFYIYFFYTLLPFLCFFLIISAAYYQKLPFTLSKIKDNNEK